MMWININKQIYTGDCAQGDREATADELVLWNAENTPPIAPISPRQIRMALTRSNLRAQVEEAVANGNQDLKDWWEFSTVFERSNAQVIGMCAALGVSDAACDDLWRLGLSL